MEVNISKILWIWTSWSIHFPSFSNLVIGTDYNTIKWRAQRYSQSCRLSWVGRDPNIIKSNSCLHMGSPKNQALFLRSLTKFFLNPVRLRTRTTSMRPSVSFDSQKEDLYLCDISCALLPVLSLQNLPTGLLSGMAWDNSSHLGESTNCSHSLEQFFSPRQTLSAA